jgi:hypothetical protein
MRQMVFVVPAVMLTTVIDTDVIRFGDWVALNWKVSPFDVALTKSEDLTLFPFTMKDPWGLSTNPYPVA